MAINGDNFPYFINHAKAIVIKKDSARLDKTE